MDAITAIKTRRSIRSFTPQPVSAANVTAMLEAAMAAPSAGNAQPWHFVIIDDEAALKAIPAIHPYAGMAARAPLAILVCGDTSTEKFPGFWVQDCSAAIQNLLLAAVAQGLGAVWTGIHPVEDRAQAFAKMFALPKSVTALALIIIGHPKDPQNPVDRFNEKCIHHNRW